MPATTLLGARPYQTCGLNGLIVRILIKVRVLITNGAPGNEGAEQGESGTREGHEAKPADERAFDSRLDLGTLCLGQPFGHPDIDQVGTLSVDLFGNAPG